MRATDVMSNKATSCRNAVNVNAMAVEQKPLRLRNYLPHLLSGVESRYQPLPDAGAMLKSATEFYLGAPVSTAGVAFLFPVPHSYRNFLRSASSTLSFHMPLSIQSPAGILAAKAHGLIRNCHPDFDPAQLILTVGYTRASLKAPWYMKYVASLKPGARFMILTLGSMSFGEDLKMTTLNLRVSFVTWSHCLKDGGNGANIDHISDLVLLGDSADDRLLHHVLKKVPGEQQAAHLVTTAIDRHKRPTDPLFVASRGLALDCWDWANFLG